MKRQLSLILIGLSLIGAWSPAYSLTVDEAITRSVENYAKVQDYTCLMHRKERIGKRLKEQNNIQMRFMKPLCVYFKWTEGEFAGCESIFVKGRYGDKLKFHKAGLGRFIKLSLNPKGHLAMRNNRHSIDESGVGHIIDLIVENYQRSRERKEGTVTLQGEGVLDGRKTFVYQADFPEGKGYYGGVIHIYMDAELILPVKIEVYDWNGELLEMYHFAQLKINPGLTEKDFDVKNPAYRF
ncbi:MAG: DUF1571 domain-containing protein [Elusimicrobiota bacterium]